jgi:uncharacterized membrane protein YdjX (TVP38/TMEM64 family)
VKKFKQILILSIPLIGTIIFSVFLQTYLLSSPGLLKFITSQFGPYLIVFYIILQTITTVVPPLSAAFMQIAVLAVFGPITGNILLYLVMTPLYIVNFMLARRYGRPWVIKVMGEQALDNFDKLITDAGTPTLALLKVFQANVFDFIAYAYGLTKVDLRTFAVVNFVGGIPSAILSYFILSKFSNFAVAVGVMQILTILFAVGYVIVKRKRLKKSAQK